MTTLLYGDKAARIVSGRIADPLADLPTLRLVPGKRCSNNQSVFVTANQTEWIFNTASALADDGVTVVKPSDGSAGAWLLIPGTVELKLPFTFATADAAILWTVPTGALFMPTEFMWQITADMTGGASSAIGVSSSTKTGYTGKGNLLGGASGDVAAALTNALGAVVTAGTIGTNWATIANKRMTLGPTDTLRFDRITSAFTAGAGSVSVFGQLLRNAGA